MKAIRNNITIILTVIVLTCSLFFGVSTFIPKPKNATSTMVTKVISVNEGYGYQILDGDKILIQQDVIPAAAGKQSFRTVKDAQFVADLVRYKLLKGDSPMLTVQELEEFDIVMLAHH